MFNLGGGELMVILLVALLVLGPAKLPTAAKQVGKVMSDFRNMSAGFQREMREAMQDPVEAVTRDRSSKDQSAEGSGTADPQVSTAEQAGMFEAESPPPTDPAGDEDDS